MRYAIYYTPPPAHPLTRQAAQWLGRDAFSGAPLPQACVPGLDADAMADLTAEPQRYGFHATIIAPFRPAAGVSEAKIVAAFEAFCEAHDPARIGMLHVSRLGNFLALTPVEPSPEVNALQAAAVHAFTGLRAPLGEAEIARRRPERLTMRQRDYLDRHGYPYVLDEFRFHMTLTGPLERHDTVRIEAAAEAHFGAALALPPVLDHLALFVQTEAGVPFTVHSLMPVGSAAAARIA